MSQNVVLVTIDSLRADCASPDTELMPNLAALADHGVSYEQAFSNGYSTPVAFPAILTGTHPAQYGGYEYMSDRRPFLARHLHEHGYHTTAFHSNPHLRTGRNYDTGFDDYADFENTTDTGSSLRYLVTRNLDSDSRLYSLLRRAYQLFRSSSGSADYLQAPAMNSRAFRWLDETWDDSRLFFLWNHYMDVHYPFYPPEEYVDAPRGRNLSTRRRLTLNGRMHEDPSALTERDKQDLRALYEGEIRYMDDYLGRFLTGLENRGLLDDTLVVVTSDHGELFGEYGQYGHPPVLHDELLHVPLVMAGPEVPRGMSVDQQTALVDLAPTISSILGLDPHSAWVGQDTTVFFDSDEATEPRQLILGDQTVLGCQTPTWRLVQWVDATNRFDKSDEWELWNRETSDQVALADSPGIVEQLQESLSGYRELVRETDERLPDVEADNDVEDRLNALGYR
ncbi:sulfatase [Salinigranum halophilum]|uniref:sulfatase n=1 Tax=Salinigranum halophilum TaxID=2565931 RepID=UPI0010A7B6E3|nr:sulfatase [Salinigranum halophilum]